jgi:hypothetical protein
MGEEEVENRLWTENEWSKRWAASSSGDPWSASSMSTPAPETWYYDLAFGDANAEFDSLSEDYGDSTLIMQLLRDNLTL